MKAGNFTGISGFPNQDVAMWLTMGPIADRSHDRLGASDLAIVEFRRQMLDAVQAFAKGEPAIGTGERGGHAGGVLVPGHRAQDHRLAQLTRRATSGPTAGEHPATRPSYSVEGLMAHMSKLQLSVAMGDYDRTRALFDGRVQIDGVDPVYMLLNPEEMFFRSMRSADFDITELSFSSYLVKHSRRRVPVHRACRSSCRAPFATPRSTCARTASGSPKT